MTGLPNRIACFTDTPTTVPGEDTVDVWNRKDRVWETIPAQEAYKVIEVKPASKELDPFWLTSFRTCVGALFGLAVILVGTILVRMILEVWKGIV